VPLSGNIGFTGSEKGTFQTELSYDLVYLAMLKQGREFYDDQNRLRITHSVLWKAGYNISNRLAVDALFSYVAQERRISYQGTENRVHTHRVGDAVLIGKLLLSSMTGPGMEIQLNVVPEIPLYSQVKGVQLTPSFRIQAGIYYRFGGKNQNRQTEGSII
jgi:hypothetical protein